MLNNQSGSNIKYDAILLVTDKSLPVLEISLPYIKKNLGVQKIYAIAPSRIQDKLKTMSVGYIDEDSLIPGLTFRRIKQLIENRGLDTNRTGWYYQQFLKYGFSYVTKNEYYLTWDADTIPLNSITYFNDGKPSFVEKKEMHQGYFNTLNTLFRGEIYRYDSSVSFVAENMLFNTTIVREVIERIESNDSLDGNTFYEKIINAVEPEDFQSGFSEFETYGNYVKIKHPDLYGSLNLRTLRNGSFFVGIEPTQDQVEWAQRDFDIMSIEGRETFVAKLSTHKWFRKVFRLKTISKLVLKMRSMRRTILGLEKLDYD